MVAGLWARFVLSVLQADDTGHICARSLHHLLRTNSLELSRVRFHHHYRMCLIDQVAYQKDNALSGFVASRLVMVEKELAVIKIIILIDTEKTVVSVCVKLYYIVSLFKVVLLSIVEVAQIIACTSRPWSSVGYP
ncbi:hypothetical protein BD289DRAFT_48578 [Coniella lustricola]|uniref:Secreted protein n=1 Tax=Coniella lustricola TaxID=2025994 RepID=A0A2T3AIH3_9PEZI|nr:hypothetical protein BD289DRAFT_48578 [Coniella lustricola]